MDLFSRPAAGGVTPRPYQTEAVDAAFREWRTVDSTLVHLATGLGKTICFGLTAARWLAERDGHVLVLAHQRQLVSQAADELAAVLGFPPDVEMADRYASPHARVVVASVQTLAEHRLNRWPADRFGLVVADECHHTVEGVKTFMRPLQRFAAAKKLGVTATPERHDKRMLGGVWKSVAYSMGIERAVDEAWLVPVEQQFVRVNHLDLSAVSSHNGDLDKRELSHALTRDQRLSLEIAAAVEKHCAGEPTLIFTAPRHKDAAESQGEQVAAALNDLRPGCALYLTGQTSDEDRRRHYARFARGEFDRLVGCNLFLEGFNVPAISRVVMARPTESRALFEQMAGRGTRPLRGLLDPYGPAVDTAAKRQALMAGSPKPFLRLLDICGNSGRHKLVTALDLFAGRASAAVRERARKTAEETGRPARVQTLLREAEAEEREARYRARVETSVTDVDPFGHGQAERRARPRAKATDPATPKQVEWLRANGGVVPDNPTVAAAGGAIAEVHRRRREGLCSPKQERTLRHKGLADGPLPKAHAKALLDLLSSRDWRPLDGPLRRGQLSIVADGAGFYRLAVRHQVDGMLVRTTVGGAYPTEADVRAAYRTLCPEPALA